MADITEPLQYGRLTGDFWAVLEDSSDLDLAPDTSPLMGSVVFTPSYRVLRVSGEPVDRRGVVYVDSVTAQVVNGVLVDEFGEPGVSLLAATELGGTVIPNDISWTATFNLLMSDGGSLTSQPEPTRIRLAPGETRSISDFVPSSIDGGGNVKVVSVDRETMRLVDSQVEYINNMVEELSIIIEDGVAKGEPGEKGDTGERGPIGPYGPPGRAGLVETINYVTNPTPTSNNGFSATNGIVSFSEKTLTLTLTPTDASKDSYITWVKAVPSFPGTNMYLRFDAAPSDTTVDVLSTITFLNAELAPVDFDTLVHSGDNDLEAPEGVESESVGTFSHMSYTDGPASFAIFSVGIPAGSPEGTTLVVDKFFFSDTPGYYFTGDDTIKGYNTRWMGEENNSYSVLTPVSSFANHVVTSLNDKRGDLTINAETLGLGLVNNTSDEDKPVSRATQEALDLKVDKSSLISTLAAEYKDSMDSMYLKEFSRFATQEVWTSEETFVDISYVMAPMGATGMVRLTIPGSKPSAGTKSPNSGSSIPTVEVSNDGSTWTSWRELTSGPPESCTSIDGEFDKSTGNLKVLVRESISDGPVVLRLYTITQDGTVSDKSLDPFDAASEPYTRPSIVATPQNDGSLYMYYTNADGDIKRKTISAAGDLGTTIALPKGLQPKTYAKVSRFYGSYVAATPDGSVAGSPGIMISADGDTWRGKPSIVPDPATGAPSTHTWSRGASVVTMSAYPGVSGGKVGIFIDYINDPNEYHLHRIFITARPVITGKFPPVTTAAKTTDNGDGLTISFPGTLYEAPTVIASSDDTKLILATNRATLSRDKATIDRFNVGDAESKDATITWTAIS